MMGNVSLGGIGLIIAAMLLALQPQYVALGYGLLFVGVLLIATELFFVVSSKFELI